MNTVSSSHGSQAVLPCYTGGDVHVIWTYYNASLNKMQDVAVDGVVVERYTNRGYMDCTETGYHNLVINSTMHADSGLYVCTERNGKKTAHHVTLEVAGELIQELRSLLMWPWRGRGSENNVITETMYCKVTGNNDAWRVANCASIVMIKPSSNKSYLFVYVNTDTPSDYITPSSNVD